MEPHHFWQEIHPAASFDASAPLDRFYPATLADGRQLLLPIRPLSDGTSALASLIVNQASFSVLDALSGDVADRLKAYAPEVIVGLPTLGLTLAAPVAHKLAHGRYVPLGTSRKFWYREELSVPISSITTPEQQKRLYVDPRMLPLLEGRRVVLVDDVISSGKSILAGLQLLRSCGVKPVAIAVAMLQSKRGLEAIEAFDNSLVPHVHAAFASPILTKGEDGYWHG
ncbi:phosphoribosyltransferase [Martelella sp. HB161492]|uniref:phosphoribosyltransferase n=1 Tax=Martelella sp. HB161492 TaxID=2720726 RepID=UPI00158FBA60|nr:phosphoribosyltransferase [Martelella sp. HB161492]